MRAWEGSSRADALATRGVQQHIEDKDVARYVEGRKLVQQIQEYLLFRHQELRRRKVIAEMNQDGEKVVRMRVDGAGTRLKKCAGKMLWRPTSGDIR